MVLSALTHKRLTEVTPASGAVNDVLDAIYNALTASTYYDGTARTAGSGQAWTATKEISGVTVALRCHPPTGSPATGLAMAFAGVTAGAPTPQMLASDTFATNMLLAGTFRNVPGSPTWNGWDNATPYSSANFTGYSRIYDTGGLTADKILVIESAETLFVAVRNAAAGGLMGVYHGGATIDPLDSARAETSGRLIVHCGSGTAAQVSTGFHTLTTNGGLWIHVAANGSPKCVAFDYTTSDNTVKTLHCQPINATTGISATNQDTTSGYYLAFPTYCYYLTDLQLAGPIRQVYRVSDMAGHPVIVEGTTDKLYGVSSSNNATADTFAFSA